ncbi:LuxR C-terminal-related transcriptional regulator [Sulfitobacter aestuarii]|uniref:LuxR C-terminal-related transcriptional regulator n=1 Tax=Sulfitobacter aestuarii TaxID=2161676 RepID=A0ABW5TYR9_9RHOB
MLVKRAAELERADTADALWQGTVETLNSVGIDHVIYLSVGADNDAPVVRCTLAGLYDRIPVHEDPFMAHFCRSYEILPIGVEFLDSHPRVTAEDRAFVEGAGARGFRVGMAVPMRLKGSARFGGFLLGCDLDRATFTARYMPRAEEFRLFCLIIHRRMEELSDVMTPPEPTSAASASEPPQRLPPAFDSLSPREREVIHLLAEGHSRGEAAQICNLSIHTVSDYAKAAYRKLGVRNRAQVAALLHAEDRDKR